MAKVLREPFNGFSHLVGAVLAIIGLLWLIQVTAHDTGRLLAALIYGISLTLVFGASAIYHSWKGSTRIIRRLQRLDHAAIYLVIAGSYTPICYNVLNGTWRWWLLGTIWTMAAIGILYKLLFFQEPGIYSLLYYLVMGCLGLLAVPELLLQLPQSTIQFLLMGGVFFVICAVIFGIEKPNLHRYFGHHELWHVMVLLGCGFHFLAVARCLV